MSDARARPRARALAFPVPLALFLAAGFQPFAARAQSVDELLNQADRALGGGSSSSPKQKGSADEDGTKPKKRERRPSKGTSDSLAPSKETTPKPASSPEAPPRVEPSAELRGVMSIDTDARMKEAREGEVSLRVGLAGGVHALPRGFLFAKDDDTFALSKSAFPVGGKVALAVERRRPFELASLTENGLALRPIAAFEVGYFTGAVSADRTGVQSGRGNYTYNIVPVVLKGGLSVSVADNAWGGRILVGLGADVVNQTGSGVTDTGTQISRGLVAAPQIFIRVSEALEVKLTAEFLGLGLSLLTPKANGRELTVGLDLSV